MGNGASNKTYIVETIEGNNFVFVGQVIVDYHDVRKAMDATNNVKDNMPSKFARREARKKYPDANPPIVMPIEEWQEKYGDPDKYKRGDIIK